MANRCSQRSTRWRYPLPPFPDKRYILRSINFINDHQGYIFGGNLEEVSQAYIFETLDGGKSWRILEADFPHIHYSIQTGNEILLCGKNGFRQKKRLKVLYLKNEEK